MIKFLALLILTSTFLVAHSQDDSIGNIDAQRPTLTESYSIIASNTLQFENGIDYLEDSDSFQYGSFLRATLLNKFELRAFTDYEHLNTVGAKFVVMHPDRTGLGLGASFIYTRDLQNTNDDFRLALSKSFENWFATYNIGYHEAFYSIVLLGCPLGEDFNYFAEYYIDPHLNRMHSGFTWIPLRDIQLDLSGGWMDTDGWYAGLGASFRLR